MAPDNPDAACPDCGGGRYCVWCEGAGITESWSTCKGCGGDGLCDHCSGTGDNPDA